MKVSNIWVFTLAIMAIVFFFIRVLFHAIASGLIFLIVAGLGFFILYLNRGKL